VTRPDVLYVDAIRHGTYDNNPVVSTPIYGIPHKSRPSPDAAYRQYRGIDREPLDALSFDDARQLTGDGISCEATEATALLDEIELATGREDGWVTDRHSIRRVWDALRNDQAKYEVIFAKESGDPSVPSKDATLLGCDAAYFPMDCFSCICDALFFPKWHGTDPEGTLFLKHFDKLNRNGLFNSNEMALEYLQYYLSFDWTERASNFTSIEVYSVDLAADASGD